MTIAIEKVVRRYIESWNETNAEKRRAILREVFADDCGYTDPHVDARGVEAVDAFIGAVQKQYAGLVFTLGGAVDAHHQQARFTWHAGPPGAGPLAIGFDVAIFEQGRIRHVYGFIDKAPGLPAGDDEGHPLCPARPRCARLHRASIFFVHPKVWGRPTPYIRPSCPCRPRPLSPCSIKVGGTTMHAMSNAHALVVGIAAYERVPPLPATVVCDAHDMYDLLVDPLHGGYPPGNVRILLDERATQAALRRELADLADRTDRDSTVVLYVSSHGGNIDSGPFAGAYLWPVDVDDASAESMARTSLPGDELTRALNALPARKVVVIFDCCHAAGIGQPKAAGGAFAGGLPERYYEALAAGRGRVILASSRSNEFSWARPGDTNSVFTKHLLAGLRGGAASDDGLVRIFDLFEYLQPRVTVEERRQHPVFKAELEENFSVALCPGGPPKASPPAAEGFRYDAYISYVDREPDATWVWSKLVPRLEEAGLRVAISGDVNEPGVARVVGVERGIRQSKRTVVVLSPAYLADQMAYFENVLAQTMGIQEGSYRLLPVKIDAIAEDQLPTRLSMLTTLDLAHARRAEREFDRLVQALKGPLARH